MDNFGNPVVLALFGIAASAAVANWVIVVANIRAARSKSGAYSSPLLGIPQIFAFIGAVLSNQLQFPWLPLSAFLAVGVFDVSVLQFVMLPFVSLWAIVRKVGRREA